MKDKLDFKLTAIICTLVFWILHSCAPSEQTPWETDNGYHGFSGRVSTVKSGNRFRIKGFSSDIKLFGVKIPENPAKADLTKIQLYKLINCEDIICIAIPKATTSKAVVGYCRVRHFIEVTDYMVRHNYAEIDCAELRRAFGEKSKCSLR